jgi:hypothetical protein
MTRTKDLFMEQQERDYEQENFEMMNELHELHHNVPPIDLGLMQPSLQTSEQIANGIIEAVKEGQINPIELAVKKKCIVDAFELAFKDDEIKKMVVSEVERYGKEGATMYGATIKVTSTGKYEYSKDQKWASIKAGMKEMEEALKAQEERIKAACKNNASLIDNETGEVIASVVPCPKTDTVAVSFKPKK